MMMNFTPRVRVLRAFQKKHL